MFKAFGFSSANKNAFTENNSIRKVVHEYGEQERTQYATLWYT